MTIPVLQTLNLWDLKSILTLTLLKNYNKLIDIGIVIPTTLKETLSKLTSTPLTSINNITPAKLEKDLNKKILEGYLKNTPPTIDIHFLQSNKIFFDRDFTNDHCFLKLMIMSSHQFKHLQESATCISCDKPMSKKHLIEECKVKENNRAEILNIINTHGYPKITQHSLLFFIENINILINNPSIPTSLNKFKETLILRLKEYTIAALIKPKEPPPTQNRKATCDEPTRKEAEGL